MSAVSTIFRVNIQGRGSHSGLCASNRMGAFPSRIPSRLNLAACRITDIVCPCRPSHPTSPGSRSIIVETAATSGSSGAHRGGRGRPSPKAVSGCKFPNRRIHKSVALSETCTRHEPPSYSIPTHRLKGGSYEDGLSYLRSRFCRARLRCRMRGDTPPRDLALAWAKYDAEVTWQLLPLRTSHGRTQRMPRLPVRWTLQASARASRTTTVIPRSFILCSDQNSEKKPTLLTSCHGPPGENPVRDACTIPGRHAAHSSGPNPRAASPRGR